jgi:hypothetical protein
MAAKNTNNKKAKKSVDHTRQRRSAQVLFALFAVILILSMLLSAITNY